MQKRRKSIQKFRRAMHETIAERIEGELGQFENGILPSISDLAGNYKTSVVTVRKALKSLEYRGKITCVRGKRSRVVGVGDEPDSQAVRRLLELLSADIREGRLRAGDPMPKLEAVVLEHHVSRSTAHQALKELERQGKCHRIGRRRFVGTKPEASMYTPALGSLPVVIILTRTHSTYTHLFRSERTIDFMIGFHNELEKMGTRLLLASWGGCEPGVVETELGLVTLSDLIARQGGRYAGTAALSSSSDQSARMELMETAFPFRRPVVNLFTGNPDVPYPGQMPVQKNYRRCIFDEWAAVRLALETLASLGHQTICIPNLFKEYEPWVTERIRKARYLSDKLRLGIEIVHCGDSCALDSFDELGAGVESLIARWEAGDPELARAMRDAYGAHGSQLRRSGLAAFGVMSTIRRKKNFTAILAPNDIIADGIYRWIRYRNLRVPHELSVLSFDNNYKYRHLPISTIDFGMNYAGYAAAQLFMGQVEVPVSSDGTIKSHCHLVHRGSLGPPSRTTRAGYEKDWSSG